MPIKKQSLKIGLASGLIAFSACLVSSGLAYGHGGDSVTPAVHAETETKTEVETETHKSSGGTTTATAKKAAAKAKLADAKKKVCEVRSAHIQQKMANIVQHANKQLGVFDKIADRTKAFAEDKQQKPAGYDALVADVASKRQAVVDGIADMSTDQSSFTCDGDAHGVASEFKANLKTEIALMKAYKTSIRNLIVGVKSANNGEKPDDTADHDKAETNQ